MQLLFFYLVKKMNSFACITQVHFFISTVSVEDDL